MQIWYYIPTICLKTILSSSRLLKDTETKNNTPFIVQARVAAPRNQGPQLLSFSFIQFYRNYLFTALPFSAVTGLTLV